MSDSKAAFDRLRNWIDDCDANHGYCDSAALNPPLPTRVIDVSVSDRSVALWETKGQRGRYISLSHCWGSTPRLKLTEATLEDLKDGIAISYLPKTFCDAIRITKEVGLRYLWIDCLYIIQDDRLDWLREAATMGQVYRNSYLTVSASSSVDSYMGCFPSRTGDSNSYVSPGTRSLGYDTPRDVLGPGSCQLDLWSPLQPAKSSHLYLFEEWLPGSTSNTPQVSLIGAFGKCFDPLAEEPISTRAWTLQERLLSPRIIYYTKDQMYFECESILRSEDGSSFLDTNFNMKRLLATQLIAFEDHGLPRDSGISFIAGRSAGSFPISPIGRWEGGWLMLIEDFSKRKLTKPQDKLPALSGLARAIAQETNDRYLAGLWANHLIEDLHWRVYAQEENEDNVGCDGHGHRVVKGKIIGDIKKPDKYRAPSWSWASLDAPVRFIPLNYSLLVARVLRCSTTPAGPDAFGMVSDGKLDIQVSTRDSSFRNYANGFAGTSV